MRRVFLTVFSWLAWTSLSTADAQSPESARVVGTEQDALVQIREFAAEGQIAALAFSPDREQLAVRVPTSPNVSVWG